MTVNPKKSKDPNRDIFLLSKGHAALALYATLSQKGFFDKDLMMTYDQDGFHMAEHASTQVPGVELSTGSLGHALPVGIGFATSFKNDKKPNQVYVLLSDGELDEGSNWEAIMFAGHHQVNNLTVVIDRNSLQGYSETNKVLDLSPLRNKFEVFGWAVYECNGHDFNEINNTFVNISQLTNNKPKIVIAQTIKGKGVPYFEGKFESHYQSVDEKTKQELINNFK